MTIEDKPQLRARYRALREGLKSPERDEQILQKFLASPFFEKSSFFVYHSVGAEADTLQIIKALLAADKQVYLPRIAGKNMLAAPYSLEREIVFGIPQPKEGGDHSAEVIITPLLAFDQEGYRLGCGGGYYDRYFASHKGVRVGLCYQGQAVKALPRGRFDLPLDAVVTEAGVEFFT